MIDKIRDISLLNIFMCFLLFVFGINVVSAAVFKEITFNEEEYILVDVEVRELTLLTDTEIYQYENEFYIPYLPIVQALELENNTRINDGYIQVRVGDKNNWIDLRKQTSNLQLKNDLNWSNNGFDLFININVLAELLNVKIEYISSRLLLEITPINTNYLFPIEKRLNRSAEDKRERRTDLNKGDARYFFSQEVLLDHYHLITPPSGAVGLSLFTSDNNKIGYGVNTSLSADFLYHSASLSLFKTKDRAIRSNLKFIGTPKSPYEIMPLNIGYYDFGDVSASATGGSAGGQGLGFTLRSSERDFSRDFGTTVIEGQATPGWEVELYLDGFFIAQQTVSEQGIYKFENVATEYGVNTYKVKLFGPFGEEEERVETLEIKGNWLKPGKTRFKAGVLESNQYLLHGALEDGYDPDNMYFGLDYGLTERHQLGITLSGIKEFESGLEKELEVNVQSVFESLLIDNEFTFEDNKFHYGFSGQGQISRKLNYNVDYNYYKFGKSDTQPVDIDTHQASLKINGATKLYFPISYGFRANFIKNDKEAQLSSISARLSTSSGSQNFYNNTTYYFEDSDTDAYLSGVLGYSGKFFGGRVNFDGTYSNENEFRLVGSRLNYFREFDSGYNLNFRADYTAKEIRDDGVDGRGAYWGISSSIIKSFEQFGLSGNFQYNSDNSWVVGVGLNFSLGYDHVNDELKISNGGLFGGATLDLTAYLDRNSNNILDENDLALKGVEFGPYNNWTKYKTGDTGQVILQGVPANRTVNFTGGWGNGVSPSVSSYSLYTHNGGYIKANIPFTIKTDVVGYLYVTSSNGENAIKEAPIELIDANGVVSKMSITSHDGYYEFIGVNAGDYHIRVNADFLSARGLRSQPSMYHFPTPPQGGFVEIQELVLYPMNSQIDFIGIKEVELNEANYDPAVAKEKAGQGIYITPQKGSFKPGSQKLKPVKLKSASIVKPNAAYTVIKDNGFEEQIVDSIKGNNAVEVVVPPSLVIEETAPNTESPLIEDVVQPVERKVVENVSVTPSVLNVTPTWVLQFASYKSKDNALLDLNAFQTKFADQELTVVEDKGWFKVIKPGFKSADKASLMGQLIKDKYGIDSFVTQLSLPVNTTTGEQGSIGMAKPDAKFSIQLAAIQNENLAIELIKKMPQGHDYFTAKKDDKTLVLLGMFSTKQDALKLSKTLDESIQNNMWIRTLTGISNISSVIK